MEWLLISVTALCIFLVLYHHVGYPALLAMIAKRAAPQPTMKDTRCYRSDDMDNRLPAVTLIIPAYNEEEWIAEKIRNVCSLDYPSHLLKVWVACDGCTDDTASIAYNTIQEAICEEIHIEIFDFDVNQGKVAMVNKLVSQADTDVVALSDVSSLISCDALLIAARHFEDPNVGVVNPKYQILTASHVEQQYWNYQGSIKQSEAMLGSVLGAHGAFYLFKRKLFEEIEFDTINDDFIIPMRIILRGYKGVYEPQMLALEMEQASSKQDFKRRLRISAGNLQQILRLFKLFNPKYKGVAFAFFSGKGLRVTMPYLMMTALGGSILLSEHPLFMVATALQIAGYSLALLALILPSVFSYKHFKTLAYVVSGHAASLIGGLRYILGFEKGNWERV
ncbi:putative Glycosyltransferase SypQ [Vibrio nigripulchritudo SFn27]|uniref:Putative Glycosyltransferase SypQ n=1 Tax=Vibrio nigripulchritudo TaxID=28173 RepID=U4KB95_9VIBR|nr:glycosyltransferase family 2 protein [Vibrio nigripulchritudo]CCN85210.1 putative Glycosyltransferase SypQ [Vibrio nigripulchritudo BLFn1]CCN87640.1 putative Glycosyltransferase SypQ [Vibrio nigripulchritudo SFn27]CCN92521.1 putative Glycosyltransferase SypQ [Vibrio nigripulchritudo ENn2]CCO39384.1 putative Glycosyltransferase SypQ [Vibrio nigripulchritudo SFn135]CCO53388.1 putative Glycosyltransferase SypQ [Vibrio nigripulchritudo Wn13]